MDSTGAGSSNDPVSETDLTFRRSKRFRSRVLSYWDFERITCIPTSYGNKIVVARDIPGEGTIIEPDKQPSILAELSPPKVKDLHRAKSLKRKQTSQERNAKPIHPAISQSKQSSILFTATSTSNKTRLSGSPKKRRLYSLGHNFLEQSANAVNTECQTSDDEASCPPKVTSDLDQNKTDLNSSQGPNKGKDCFSKRKRTVDSSESACLPTLDDPGYVTGHDSFSSTLARADRQFAMVVRTVADHSPTGQYSITRALVHDGFSVYFLHITQGYVTFKTHLNLAFTGIKGEGLLTLLNGSKPSVRATLRPDVEVHADKGAVVAITCEENCRNLAVCMISMADKTDGETFSN